jgi:hypothetical protein
MLIYEAKYGFRELIGVTTTRSEVAEVLQLVSEQHALTLFS